MNYRKLALRLLGLCSLLAVIGGAAIYISNATAGIKASPGLVMSPDLIARGAYLAKLGDCAACHSAAGRPPFAGGLRMNTPVGAIYTTNITPDPDNGIGRFSLADFDRALRFGVSQGHTLYPAMPFVSYANTKPEDVEALYAYFRQGVAAAPVPNRRPEIPFPLSMRWPLTVWRWLWAPRPAPFQDEHLDPQAARGAYFVEGLGHCGECHTPRGIAFELKARAPAEGALFLSGAVIENWYAPSLRSGGTGTLEPWSEADIEQFLTQGVNRHGAVFGSMSDVIVHSSQYLMPDDARATAKYLKSLKDNSSAAAFAYDAATDHALSSGDATRRGAMTYLDNCAACHRPDGRGYDGVFPSLAGNPAVEASNATSVVSIVLGGSSTPRTPATPAQFAMPAFAWRLSDQEVADVVTFVRSSWGNRGNAIEETRVHDLRHPTQNGDHP
jgi:alcohol dehydrogenase (quinone), cytochrome c subunit